MSTRKASASISVSRPHSKHWTVTMPRDSSEPTMVTFSEWHSGQRTWFIPVSDPPGLGCVTPETIVPHHSPRVSRKTGYFSCAAALFVLEYKTDGIREGGRTIRLFSTMVVVCGAALAVSGCTTLDQIALRCTRTDRQRIFQLYGNCLHESRGDLPTLAKYCNSVAENRHAREKEVALDRCPLSEYFPCLQQ